MQQIQQLLTRHQQAELRQGSRVVDGNIILGIRLVNGLQNLIIGLRFAEAFGFGSQDGTHTMDAVDHLLTGLKHMEFSLHISCYTYFNM